MDRNFGNQIILRTKYAAGVMLWKHAVKSLSSFLIVAAVLCFIVISGCSSSDSSQSSSTDTTTTGTTTTGTTQLATYQMPTEISAVPVDTSAGDVSATLNRSLGLNIRSLSRAATASGTDYSEAETRKFVEEHALEQFSMLENVLNALSQTNYTEEIDEGAYKAMVAFQDSEGGSNKKTLEAWVCQADSMEDDDGESYLRARAWIEEQDEGGTELIKAEFKIYAAPNKNDDGSYADYGRWDLNVKFGDDGTSDFFAASCGVNDDGIAVIKVHEKFEEIGPSSEMGIPVEMKGIMYRSESEGYGRVQYPNWEALYGPDGDPDLTELPTIEAVYAYNENYLAVKNANKDTVYKDRDDIVEMTHRYGIYNADTGDDLMKSKSFGFPIYWTTNGIIKRAYYGAWQGRHQLWTQDGESVAAGTAVTREDLEPNATPETYTVGKTFNGVLTKRTYVDASLDDIKNIPVEIWINNDYNLIYQDATWYHCSQIEWGEMGPSCAAENLMDFDAEVGLTSLAVGENDNKKQVNINGFDVTAMENKNYVYELTSSDNGNQAGFYEAQMTDGAYGPVITVVEPRQLIDTSKVNQLWIWIGGQIYVEYQGGGVWMEKELINFNEMNWTPEFGDNDKTYTLPENKELYINMQGSNYVVRKDANGTTCQLELQTAVNPINVSDIVPDGTVFKDPWNPESSSTYELIKDPDNEKFLMLVYKTIGDNDKDQDGNANEGVEVGGIVVNGTWGIEATIDGETVAFNWEYSDSGGWGSVAYLMDSDGSYKLLDDPVRFNSITAQNGAGETKTLSIQFDGWLFGIPQMYQELEKNNWTMNDDIANKIINLPAGTQLTDSVSGTEYLLKPLEISQFLLVASDNSGLPSISTGEPVDLSTVPDYVEHGMGDMPTDVELKYSEGNPIE